MNKLDLEKAEEPEIKFPTSVGSWKKQEFQKNIYFCFIDYAKAFDSVDHIKLWKILKKMEYQTTLPASLEICMQVKKQLELDMEQQTGSKSGKEYVKAVYCHTAYLTYMQSTSCETLGWINTSWDQDCQEKYQLLQIYGWHHHFSRKQRRTKKPLDESERGEWKSCLKLNIQKTKIMASSPITSWQIDGEIVETVRDFLFLGSKITADSDYNHEIKDTCSLEEKLWPT